MDPTSKASEPGGKWTGYDWTPLPFESTISVYMRWVELNAIGMPDLNKLRIRTYRPHTPKDYLDESRRVAEIMVGIGVIQEPPAEEVAIINAPAVSVVRALFSRKLRICPLCQEDGYHSFWFQCFALFICPLHSVCLTDNCQSCGQPLLDVTDDWTMSHPYQCRSCLSSVAGSEFSALSHLNLRSHADEIRRRFQPLSLWIRDIHLGAGLGNHSAGVLGSWTEFCQTGSANNYAHPINSRFWRTRPHLAHSFCQRLSGESPTMLAPPAGDITILAWRLRRAMQPRYRPRHYGNRRWRVLVVYRCTLRVLGKWLAKQTSDHPEHRCADVYPAGPLLICSTVCRQVAAFHILRYLVSGQRSLFRYSVDDDFRKERICGQACMLQNNGEFRLSIRAEILSLYSTIMHYLGKGGPITLNALAMSYWCKVPEVCRDEQEYVLGFNAFQTVPGMPLWPFDR